MQKIQIIYTSDEVPHPESWKVLTKQRVDRMNDPETYVPDHIRGGIIRYLEHGVPMGGFMTAVVSNDLKNAIGRADHVNREALSTIVAWFYNYAPVGAWGSPENVKEWIEERS